MGEFEYDNGIGVPVPTAPMSERWQRYFAATMAALVAKDGVSLSPDIRIARKAVQWANLMEQAANDEIAERKGT